MLSDVRLIQVDQPITIRHLIHHTSGLRDYLSLMSFSGFGAFDYYTDAEVIAKLAAQRQLNFAPGLLLQMGDEELQLQPARLDAFSGSVMLEFGRSDSGSVDRFLLSSGRISGIEFQRR